MYNEKALQINVNFKVFLDNRDISKFVTDFNCEISTSGDPNTASVSIYYNRSLCNTLISCLYMANLRIFVQNVLNPTEYIMVFDGNVRGLTRSRTSYKNSLAISAVDYMDCLSKLSTPIAIPMASKDILQGEQFKWKTMGIILSNVKTFVNNQTTEMSGMGLKQIYAMLKAQAFKASTNFMGRDSVAWWDDAIERIEIMGDIASKYIKQTLHGMLTNTTTTAVDSFYVMMSDVINKILFEFYQDRDGIIRIKPPYWNEPVAKCNMIPSFFIESISDNFAWDNIHTRILATGGRPELYTSPDAFSVDLTTPMAAYVAKDDTTGNYSWPLSGDDLKSLQQTSMEKKYGMSVLEVYQPLIKYDSIDDKSLDESEQKKGKNDGNKTKLLEKYCKMVYNLNMTQVNQINLTLKVPMPWLRPGFNIWVDPVDLDKVFYLKAINYTGDAMSGVSCSLSANLGRDRSDFINGKGFGAQKNINKDNVFVDKIEKGCGVQDICGPVFISKNFDDTKTALEKFMQIDEKRIYTPKSLAQSVYISRGVPLISYYNIKTDYIVDTAKVEEKTLDGAVPIPTFPDGHSSFDRSDFLKDKKSGGKS